MSTPRLTTQDLAEIRARCEAAPPTSCPHCKVLACESCEGQWLDIHHLALQRGASRLLAEVAALTAERLECRCVPGGPYDPPEYDEDCPYHGLVAGLRQEVETACVERDAARAEAARLREALEELSSRFVGPVLPSLAVGGDLYEWTGQPGPDVVLNAALRGEETQ